MNDPRMRAALAGVGAGLIAGLLFAAALRAQAVPDIGLLGLALPRSGSGWLAHMLVAALLGVVFGLFFGYTRGAWAATVSHGVMFGLLAWLIGPLSLAPLTIVSLPDDWGIDAATLAFPSLLGHLLFGSVTALGSQAAMTLLSPGTDAAKAIAEAGRVSRRRVIVLGGGFGGVAAAAELGRRMARDAETEVVLVSEQNYLLFTPLLASVAGGQLQAQHISVPLRAAAPHARLRHAVALSIDPAERTVRIRPHQGASIETLRFDQLVLALGSVPHYFDLPGVRAHSFTLKRLEDAVRLRDHVLTCLEQADAEPDPVARKIILTFVAAGGGFAGTETIAELRDLVRGVLRYYPGIDPSEPRFVLVHSRDRILPEIGSALAENARRRIEKRGIELALGRRVQAAEPGRIRLDDGTVIAGHTLVWAAGNRPNPLLQTLDCEHDRNGAIVVEPNLRIAGFERIWAIGDGAQVPDLTREGEPCPPTAQHALRQGRRVASNVTAAMAGRTERIKPYRFKSIGSLVGLGHRTAVAEIMGLRFSGFIAWLLWRGIYLSKLPGFEKRSRVLADWLLELVFPRDIVITNPESRPRDVAAGSTDG